MSSFYPGQRLSTKGERCTIRYVGPVKGKSGQWLGVEWDDATRGKHSGTHDGVEYFKCRSKHPTAGSFLRPTAAWDKPRTFLEALRSKYVATDTESVATRNQAVIRFNSKEAEEVGFEKIAKQQAQLQNLRIVVLDDLLVKAPSGSADENQKILGQIKETCPNITDLDLGRNLFETIQEVEDICDQLPKLRSLKLNGNRFRDVSAAASSTSRLSQITSISLDHMLLTDDELESILRHMPTVKVLSASSNELGSLDSCNLPRSLTSITLEDNDFASLEDVLQLSVCCPNLRTLNLKNNQIQSALNRQPGPSLPSSKFPDSLTDLDLSYNAISTWIPLNTLSTILPGLLHLRIAHNPLFSSLLSADGKPLSSADGYMLTIARLPSLQTLNYSLITEKERLNSETYYLAEIGRELSLTTADKENEVLQQHPRFKYLCEEYGEPVIQRKSKEEIDPNSLAARLLECTFYSANPDLLPKSGPLVIEIPKSCSIYTVHGILGRRLCIAPLLLRIILETGEKDRIDMSTRAWQGVQEWDSDEEEPEDVGEEWKEREEELIAGTRALGTYVEGMKARFRVEVKGSFVE